jgi:hypothetical protein
MRPYTVCPKQVIIEDKRCPVLLMPRTGKVGYIEASKIGQYHILALFVNLSHANESQCADRWIHDIEGYVRAIPYRNKPRIFPTDTFIFPVWSYALKKL